MSAGHVIVVGVVALLVGALLNADSLYATASRQDFGWQRTVARGVVSPFRTISHALDLNQPRAKIEDALGHQALTAPVARHGISRRPTVKLTPEAPKPVVRLRRGTPADPLRAWVGGDSMTQVFGHSLQARLGARPEVHVDLDYRISTGLTRPDYFDWPAELADKVLPSKPEVIVIMFGANDAQGMELPNGVFQVGEPQWVSEYRTRVAATMDLLAGDGRLVVWVGQPFMEDGQFNDRMALLNGIYRHEAATRPWVRFFDSRPVLAPKGQDTYAAYLPDSSGNPQLARQEDGVHLSRFGGDRLADAVIGLIDSEITTSAGPPPGGSEAGSPTTSGPGGAPRTVTTAPGRP